MSSGHMLSPGDILKLPPMIFGTIRWKKGVGDPIGKKCGGFDFLVEERTPTQFRVGPNGPEPIPGSSRWITLADAVTCFEAADEGDVHSVLFQVRGLHLNVVPDGAYRITPKLKGTWSPPPRFLFGYRVIEPVAYFVALYPSTPTPHIDFEVVRRSALTGRLLP